MPRYALFFSYTAEAWNSPPSASPVNSFCSRSTLASNSAPFSSTVPSTVRAEAISVAARTVCMPEAVARTSASAVGAIDRLVAPRPTSTTAIPEALASEVRVAVIARTWVERTRPYPDTGDAIQELVLTLKEGSLGTKRVGYERNSYFFPAYQQDRVHTSFQQGVLMDCFGIVEAGRATKSDAEIAVMRRAAAMG